MQKYSRRRLHMHTSVASGSSSSGSDGGDGGDVVVMTVVVR